MQAGRITAGYVVLFKRDERTVVEERPIADLVADLDGLPPRNGPHGPFWWFNEDGAPQRPLPDDEVPF